MRSETRYVEIQGTKVPALGFGTWQLHGDACVQAVADALRLGYRHVDTAEAYDNEADVGEGVRRSGLPREDVWITTKVWWDDLGRNECLAQVTASLERLKTPYVDLALIHWPNEDLPMEEPLQALRELKADGKVRHMGVSNFTPSLLEKAVDMAPVLCNQVEYHPYLAQTEVLDVAEKHDLMVTAYCPLARGRVADDTLLTEIGREHGRTGAQVALRWLVQQPRVAAIPRASSPEHRRENLEALDFELSGSEMERIASLDEGTRIIDPAFAPEWEGAS